MSASKHSLSSGRSDQQVGGSCLTRRDNDNPNINPNASPTSPLASGTAAVQLFCRPHLTFLCVGASSLDGGRRFPCWMPTHTTVVRRRPTTNTARRRFGIWSFLLPFTLPPPDCTDHSPLRRARLKVANFLQRMLALGFHHQLRHQHSWSIKQSSLHGWSRLLYQLEVWRLRTLIFAVKSQSSWWLIESPMIANRWLIMDWNSKNLGFSKCRLLLLKWSSIATYSWRQSQPESCDIAY